MGTETLHYWVRIPVIESLSQQSEFKLSEDIMLNYISFSLPILYTFGKKMNGGLFNNLAEVTYFNGNQFFLS